jgi:putative addiction module component (TIGR02574 family)
MDMNPLTELLKLPGDDRAELAIALWDGLADAERDAVFELPDEQRRELDRRWQENQRDPTSAIPWSDVRSKLLG